jgi:hypothetical protein
VKGARGPGPHTIYITWDQRMGIQKSLRSIIYIIDIIVPDRNHGVDEFASLLKVMVNYLDLEISKDFATTASQTKKNKDI